MNLGCPIVTNGAFATRSSQITLSTCCIFSGRVEQSVASVYVCVSGH